MLRDAGEDLVRPVELLQALEDVGERDEGERVLGVEVEREAQIDDRRQLVALAVAGGAEPVEDLGGALLRSADDERQRVRPLCSCSTASRTIGWRGSTASNAA